MIGVTVFGWHNVLPTHHYPLGPQSIEGFERQVRAIKRVAKVIPLSELSDALQTGKRIPGRAAVLTFDDGYSDALSVIAPLLRSMDVPATFFLVTSYLDKTMQPWWEAEGDGRIDASMLDWDGARQLVKMGFEIGSHTVSHPRLADLTPSQQLDELSESRAVLSERLGVPVDTLAYPFGDIGSIDDTTAASARDAGYSVALTTRPGIIRATRNPLTLPRFFLEPSRALLGFDRIPRHAFGKVRRRLTGGSRIEPATPAHPSKGSVT